MYPPELTQQLEGHQWLQRLRKELAINAQNLDLPSIEEEEWRYSPIDELEPERFQPVVSKPTLNQEIDTQLSDSALTISMVDGFLLSYDESEDYEISSASHIENPVEFPTPTDLLSYTNLAFSPDPLMIHVPKGIHITQPLVINHYWQNDQATSFPYVHIELEDNAELSVVEIFHQNELSSLVVSGTKILIGSGSNVRYQQIQNLGSRMWQLGALDVTVGQQANFNGAIAAVGGSYARVKTNCRLSGRGASGKVSAIYHGNESQTLDFRTHQEHIARDTLSDLLFKGVLDNESTSIYTGLIQVHKGAAGSNAFQTNKTIKLSDQAWAESVPNLEIENNDVKCSHASTVSPIDADQRFYLESRGIPTLEVDKLIVSGFLQEVVSQLPVGSINGWIAHLLNEKLNARDIHEE